MLWKYIYVLERGRKGHVLKVPFVFSFCKTNIFLLGASYFHAGRDQKLTLCREGSTASLLCFLVAPLAIANPQPLFTSSGRSLGFCLWLQPQAASSSSLCLSDPGLLPFPLYHNENGDKLNNICLVTSAWINTIGRVISHRTNITQGKQGSTVMEINRSDGP